MLHQRTSPVLLILLRKSHRSNDSLCLGPPQETPSKPLGDKEVLTAVAERHFPPLRLERLIDSPVPPEIVTEQPTREEEQEADVEQLPERVRRERLSESSEASAASDNANANLTQPATPDNMTAPPAAVAAAGPAAAADIQVLQSSIQLLKRHALSGSQLVPNKFSGTPSQDGLAWLKDFAKFSASMGLTDEDKLTTFPSYIDGNAERWFEDEVPAGQKDTWAHLEAAF